MDPWIQVPLDPGTEQKAERYCAYCQMIGMIGMICNLWHDIMPRASRLWHDFGHAVRTANLGWKPAQACELQI